MKYNLIGLSFFLIFCLNADAQNFIDKYFTDPLVYTNIGNSSNSINQPRDLDFKPNTNELWVVNKGNTDGGSTVIFYDAGLPTQVTDYRKDTHTAHFMMYSSSMAFSENGEWASMGEVQNTSGGGTFMGPTLWAGDTSIFARIFQNDWVSGLPLGSHLDMLHQSPFGMGIASDSAKVYWVFDGYNGNICKYDFVMDHGPGFDNHSAGMVWRYLDVPVVRENNVPSHMVLDKSTGWLYFNDTGTKKLKRMNTLTGAITGNLSATNETLALYKSVGGATVEVIDTYSTFNCGIDAYNGRLIVGDYNNGNIYVYDITGANPVFMDTIITGQSGMMGLKIGPDGQIWFVNNSANTVVRIDVTPATDDAEITKIVSPIMSNSAANYYSADFQLCSAELLPTVKLSNLGTNMLTSVTINYRIDNGVPNTFAWSGMLMPAASDDITLPVIIVPSGEHTLTVYTSNPNGIADLNPANDSKAGSFRIIDPVMNLPLSETFTTGTFPPVGWEYIYHGAYYKMSRVATVGGFGATPKGCLKMSNFYVATNGDFDITGQEDYFISPRLNFSTATNVQLTFSVAYAQYLSSNDKLEVLASTDCGNTWTSVYSKEGSALSTTSPKTSAFTPLDTMWRKETVNLNAFMAQPEVMFMFKTTSNYGNNLYIDDIKVESITGVNSVLADNKVAIFPNPSNGMFKLRSVSQINSVTVINLLGARVIERNLIPQTELNLDLSSFASGLYLIRINTDLGTTTEKVIIE